MKLETLEAGFEEAGFQDSSSPFQDISRGGISRRFFISASLHFKMVLHLCISDFKQFQAISSKPEIDLRGCLGSFFIWVLSISLKIEDCFVFIRFLCLGSFVCYVILHLCYFFIFKDKTEVALVEFLLSFM
ncbi:unnamed protein product [Amaranthus hypochondriacus]